MDSKELKGLMEAYSEVYAPQEEIEEAVKGESSEKRKDLAAERRAGHRPLPAKEGEKYAKYKMAQMDYTKRKRMGEEVEQVDENRYAMRNPEEYERAQRKPRQKSERERRMNDPHIGINSPAFQQFMRQQMGSSGGGKKKTNEEVDVFDLVLEYLIFSGEAETEQEALYIMANDQEVVEAYVDYRKGKLSGGRSPQQVLKGKQELNKARAATRANYDLSTSENPDAAKFKARAAKAGKVGKEMDSHTSTAGKIGKALTPGLGNRPGASPRVAYGEPNTDRHQLARHARGQSSTKG